MQTGLLVYWVIIGINHHQLKVPKENELPHNRTRCLYEIFFLLLLLVLSPYQIYIQTIRLSLHWHYTLIPQNISQQILLLLLLILLLLILFNQTFFQWSLQVRPRGLSMNLMRCCCEIFTDQMHLLSPNQQC